MDSLQHSEHIEAYKRYAKIITGYEDFVLLGLYRTFRPDIVKRTEQQNKSAHKYFELLAEGLNDAGYDMRVFLEKAPKLNIPWNKESIKELWRIVQKAMTKSADFPDGKESTADLTTIELQEIYKVFDNRIMEISGVRVEWPSEESLSEEQRGE